MNLGYFVKLSQARKRLVLMQLRAQAGNKATSTKKDMAASNLIRSSFLESHRERPDNLMIYTRDVRE